jgi:predicted DNA binding CopG/RHH family protein
MSKRLKKLPALKSDKEAEDVVARADLSQYDLSGFEVVHFEFEKKSARVTMRLPEPLLEAVKQIAAKRGIPYQRFIREALEKAVKAGEV